MQRRLTKQVRAHHSLIGLPRDGRGNAFVPLYSIDYVEKRNMLTSTDNKKST
jgi:hypothetical protein